MQAPRVNFGPKPKPKVRAESPPPPNLPLMSQLEAGLAHTEPRVLGATTWRAPSPGRVRPEEGQEAAPLALSPELAELITGRERPAWTIAPEHAAPRPGSPPRELVLHLETADEFIGPRADMGLVAFEKALGRAVKRTVR